MANEILQDYEEIVEEHDNTVDLATVMKGDCPECGNPMGPFGCDTCGG